MGYRLNRLDEPVFIAASKPLLTEFGLHHRLESCVSFLGHQQMYDFERFYGTKVGFYKGTDSYKSYKLVQTCYFSMFLMP